MHDSRSALISDRSSASRAIADQGRREHRLADAPCFATPVQLIWRERRWRCREPRCPTGVRSEEHPALPARAKLTARAVDWAVQTSRWDDSTVSALDRQLGVDCHTSSR